MSNNDEDVWTGTVSLLQNVNRTYSDCSSLLTGEKVILNGSTFSMTVEPFDVDVIECDVEVS